MKALPLLIVLFTLSSAAAELKIATLDVQRVFAEYGEATEAAKQFREKEVSFQKEIQGLRLEGRRLLSETDELKKAVDDNALSAAAREGKRKALEAKLADLRTFEVKYDNVRSQREAELQTLLAQTNKRITTDLLAATRAIGEKDGVNLILNASQANPLAGGVLYSKDVPDVTEKVLATLNKPRN